MADRFLTKRARLLILLGLLALGLLMMTLVLIFRTVPWPFQPARLLTQPEIVSVAGNQAWQDTGLALAANQTIDIEYLSGAVMDASTTITDANGLDYSCNDIDCCEPLRSARRSALIAQIGTSIVFIGNAQRVTAPSAGTLRLRINDCDEGLFDNSGTLIIRVAPEHSFGLSKQTFKMRPRWQRPISTSSSRSPVSVRN